MGKKYDHRIVEPEILGTWNGLYDWNEDDPNPSFSIDTPPPTISGELHMGHVFSYCHIDYIARYHRMKGKRVFYPMGFDDNGLPTERLVEKIHKIKAHSTPRKDFQELCQEVSANYREKFRMLFNRLGLSIDWNLSYNTASKECRRISQKLFLDLYEKQYIYRKTSAVPWDTVDQTTIAQAEMVDIPFKSMMNHLVFSIAEDGQQVTIATTRPELLPACVALFYHPDDQRYTQYQGLHAIVPLCNFRVPILPDENVIPEKGTGLVMCCTFGDELDIKWQEYHKLPIKSIVDKKGKLYNTAKYLIEDIKIDALSVKDARKKIIDICLQKNILIQQQPIEHSVKCAERSENPLEFLYVSQFYIKVLENKQKILEVAKKINWLPPEMRIKLEQWIIGMKWDWCISRQRYFGVPIPIWYDKDTDDIVLPDNNMLPVDPLLDERENTVPETDVLDTWATSSITPQINAHMGLDDNRLGDIFPFMVRNQSHEIIRTWAFYTIVRSMYHNDSYPWHNIMISGWCINENKEKLSKSKSNASITPTTIIEQYGADAVRYWAALATVGHDTVLSLDVMQAGKKLVNKLWNAGKFVASFFVTPDIASITQIIDKWAFNEVVVLCHKVEANMESFAYYRAIKDLESFFMNFFCDNYLELVKYRAYNTVEGHDSVCNTLSIVYIAILRMFAIFLPFISDHIYRNLLEHSRSIHESNTWLQLDPFDMDDDNLGYDCFSIMRQVREIKTQKKISIKKILREITIKTDNRFLQEIESDLLQVCNVESINWEIVEDSAEAIVLYTND
ncbi:MAG: valyl-tRNA synthetase [Candidatus Xenolissoclinum pacificiensis L6]|uniref:Valine--tRNA ligase n=1 Tax=Candidatus Xenolissoclinum pacificiensis L6 TaxID=1401685 RepID=W2UZ97_9RICK|nr:MAG: valyl-tRNA synthetase [Candidatus Xenolissoclinum pacificiensis L6]